MINELNLFWLEENLVIGIKFRVLNIYENIMLLSYIFSFVLLYYVLLLLV